MCNFSLLMVLAASFMLSRLHAAFLSQDFPIPFFQSVNLVNGQVVDPNAKPGTLYDYYTVGINRVGDQNIHLKSDDFRIGRVKSIKQQEVSSPSLTQFAYSPYSTEILDTAGSRHLYRYSKEGLLTAVEQYIPSTTQSMLYRSEKLSWDLSRSTPLLISRVLEDGEGRPHVCQFFQYNEHQQLVKKTLYGNLSGSCPVSLCLQPDGNPLANGIESYSTTYTYSPHDPDIILSEEEDNGKVTHYHYDYKNKKVIGRCITSPDGQLARYFYHYDSQERLIKVMVDNGQSSSEYHIDDVTYRQIVLYQYQGQSQDPAIVEKKYWDPQDGQEKLLECLQLSYDGKGQLTKQEFYDANGLPRYSLNFNYDEQGKLISTIDSRGEIASSKTQNTLQKVQQRLSSLDGNETDHTYDALGRLIKTVCPAVLDEHDRAVRFVIQQGYDIGDHLAYQQQANGQTTTFRYNARGQPTLIHQPDGSAESYLYSLDGQLKEKTNAQGHRICFERDAFGRIQQTSEYAANGQCLKTLTCSYAGPLLMSVTDDQGRTTHFQYDAAARSIGSLQETSSGTRKVEWDYDATGQKFATKEWLSLESDDFVSKIEKKNLWQQTIETHLKDEHGQLQRVISAQPHTESQDFIFSHVQSIVNDRYQHVKQQEIVDGYGNRLIQTYDALERLEKALKLNSLGSILFEIDYRYDADNRKILERHHVVKEGVKTGAYLIQWAYDPAGRLKAIYEGVGSPQQRNTYYQYNLQGQLEVMTKPDGNQILYTYGETGLLIALSASDHSLAYEYLYDDQQRLIQVKDKIHNTILERTYDAFNQLIEERLDSDLVIQHRYDLAGRQTGLILPDQSSILYHYQGCLLQSIERLSSDQLSLYQHTYTYDDQGHVMASHLGGSIGKIDYQYDSKGRLKETVSPWWSEKIPLEGYDSYHRLQRLDIQDPLGSFSQTFTYTDEHQLVQEEGHLKQTYSYDSLHNRLSCQGQIWEIDDLHQVKGTPQAKYTYDQNGNLKAKQTSEGKWIYTYDALDRLIHVECEQQYAVSYRYDSFHRRLARIHYTWDRQESKWQQAEIERFLYDGDKEIGCANSQGELLELRVLGIGKGAEIGSAIALELPTGRYVPVHDHQGSTRCLVRMDNSQVAEFYRYSAYGCEYLFNEAGVQLEASAIGNPWRFSSKRCDAETGWIFFGKRYYDPQLGRWTTPDPLLCYDGPNRYAFVHNDPVNHYDLYGLFSIQSIWDNVSYAASCGYGFFQQLFSCGHDTGKTSLHWVTENFKSLQRIGKSFLGEKLFVLVGDYFEKTEVGCYGHREPADKLRITFINGILTTQTGLLENLDMISKSHGGIAIHYIFRPTEGWMSDIYKACLVKVAFLLGFRSIHAHLLARKWRSLIEEIGGVESGGLIIHYAHSLGGSETDRARQLLSPEEQKMIRVISFGSATMIRNEGFESVTNYVSVNDGVSYLDPMGLMRNWFDACSNVKFQRQLWEDRLLPTDHLLNGSTYKPILIELGGQFVREFGLF